LFVFSEFKKTLLLIVVSVSLLSACAPLIAIELASATIGAVGKGMDERARKERQELRQKNLAKAKTMSNQQLCAISTSNGVWSRDSKHSVFVAQAKSRGLDCDVPESLAERNFIRGRSDATICANATMKAGSKTLWATFGDVKNYVTEAKRRGLNCDVDMFAEFSNEALCSKATWKSSPAKSNWVVGVNKKYADEAKRRGLSCGVDDKSTIEVASSENSNSDTFEKLSTAELCRKATWEVAGRKSWRILNFEKYADEAKRRGLSCGVEEKTNTTVASTDAVSSDELRAAQKEADRLRDELAALKTEQAREQQTVASDNQIPLISASARNDSETNALVAGTVTDNVEVAELTIDGEPVLFNSNGSFEVSFYVPRNGKTIEIVAFDRRGNSSSKTLKLERGAIQQASGPIFSALNPSTKRVVENPNALALIIGIADYERTDARAAYADKDAQTFYDYARMKLGVPARNIKEFVNDGADELEVILAVKDWIARSTKSGQSDVYVFFAGHGLASDDGEKMYLLPYDGSPRLLEESAISRDVLFQDIAFANPRSVTVFLDTCYSGTTRGTDMLIASRPIAIRAKQSPIPEGFTVFTAAGGDQTAKPLEEAKHGLFSYFLMKGMEGDADANNDNQITAAELHQYVEQNVVQQSAGSQVPELQGDSERVLVRFQ